MSTAVETMCDGCGRPLGATAILVGGQRFHALCVPARVPMTPEEARILAGLRDERIREEGRLAGEEQAMERVYDMLASMQRENAGDALRVGTLGVAMGRLNKLRARSEETAKTLGKKAPDILAFAALGAMTSGEHRAQADMRQIGKPFLGAMPAADALGLTAQREDEDPEYRLLRSMFIHGYIGYLKRGTLLLNREGRVASFVLKRSKKES